MTNEFPPRRIWLQGDGGDYGNRARAAIEKLKRGQV